MKGARKKVLNSSVMFEALGWHSHNFRHHAEWHLALFYLELGEIEKVLDHYDEAVWTEIAGDYLDISNGVAPAMAVAGNRCGCR